MYTIVTKYTCTDRTITCSEVGIIVDKNVISSSRGQTLLTLTDLLDAAFLTAIPIRSSYSFSSLQRPFCHCNHFQQSPAPVHCVCLRISLIWPPRMDFTLVEVLLIFWGSRSAMMELPITSGRWSIASTFGLATFRPEMPRAPYRFSWPSLAYMCTKVA